MQGEERDAYLSLRSSAPSYLGHEQRRDPSLPLDFKGWRPGPLLIPRSLEDVPESRGLSPFGAQGGTRRGLGGARNGGEESQEGV